ncbi:MAG TPA: primosomal protein N' [Anaerolineae bacterium]|nr:primosomal protein N' [Anaerolineae bacterium]
MFVEVAVNLPPVRGTFDYHLPGELEGLVRPGHLVTAPFGSRHVQGVVVALQQHAKVPETRPIDGLVDPDPVLIPAQLMLAEWLQNQTRSTLIECLTLMLPPGLSQQADSLFTLAMPDSQGENPSEHRLIALLKRRGPLRGRQIQHALSRFRWRPSADVLVRRGILTRVSVLDPPSARPRRVRNARLAMPPESARQATSNLGRAGSKAAQRRAAIVEALIQERETLDVSWIYASSGGNLADLRALEEQGILALGETDVWRDPLEAMEFVPAEPPKLTPDQASAWEVISSALRKLDSSSIKPFLLHGVTGSGKTEIYLRAVGEVLEHGRRAIVLVPEIALTPQTVRRFLARFPGQIGLMHSKLSDGERYDTWRRARAGLLNVIIGPRSALFAPLPDIGLIVIDECHDDSYKDTHQAPRYHARQAAMAYSRILHAGCILGSATPDVVTSHLASKGEIHRLSLPQRILGHRTRLEQQARRLKVETRYRAAPGDARQIDLPPVRVVDMRQELRAGNRSLFSRPLQKALAETVQSGEQAILFLNRRGTATYVFCRDCGTVVRCPRCESPLIYHASDGKLLCHHCNYKRDPPTSCAQCGGERVRHFGAGTQRVESEVVELLPEARTLRWDLDTTRTKGSHDVILAHFSAHRADVLIGTQMVAKGLDLPLVTLVGVVSADTGLNLPDYRAAERTFQLLTQVAGRAGRGLLGGRVILQTYQPDHYAIRAAAKHDYTAFYEHELSQRKSFGYPPFQRLARLMFRHFSESTAETEADRLAARLRHRIAADHARADLIGPAPCFFRRRRGEFRWQIILRAADPAPLIPEDLPQGWIVDIDPVSLL